MADKLDIAALALAGLIVLSVVYDGEILNLTSYVLTGTIGVCLGVPLGRLIDGQEK